MNRREHRGRASRRAGTLLLAAATAASGLGAGPAPVQAPSTDDGQQLRLHLADDGSRQVEGVDHGHRQLLDVYRQAHGREGVSEAMRAYARDALGLQVIEGGSTSEGSAVGAQDVSATEDDGGVDVFAVGAGDIDGDGLDDLYSVEQDRANGDTTVSAVRGLDGAVLWSHDASEVDDLLPIPVGDLDRDGVVDLLIWSVQFEVTEDRFDCGESGCDATFVADLDWSIGLASGDTGETRWARDVAGSIDDEWSFTYEGTPVTSSSEDRQSLSAENLFVYPMPSGDHSGDGADDLLVQALERVELTAEMGSTAVAGAAHHSQLDYALDLETVVDLISADGTAIDRVATAGPVASESRPAGDLVGSSAPELLVTDTVYDTGSAQCVSQTIDYSLPNPPCSGLEAPETTVRLVDGDTLADVWTFEVPTDWFIPVVSPFGDLDEDGTADVVIYDVFGNDLVIVNGVDGSELDRIDGEGFGFTFPTTDMTGDGFPDLFRVVESGDFSDITFTLERFDGRTTQLVASSERHMGAPDGEESSWFGFFGMSTGLALDAVPGGDILTEVDIQGEVDGEEFHNGAIELERGSEAVTINELDGVAYDLYSAADLDGDGITDVVTMDPIEFPDCWDEDCPEPELVTTLHALSSPSLAPLWDLEADLWSEYIRPIGDIDGVTGDELMHVYTSESMVDGYHSGFAVRDGEDLEVLWSRGAPRS